MHNQISADQQDLTEAKIGIRKKTMTTEYNEFKFLVLEKMKIGTLNTFSDTVTYTTNDARFTLLFQLLGVCATFQATSAMPRDTSV
jgi:hypothetical protein